MLQQIIKAMYIDPEVLAELSDEQKELLFCKMREEQIRRYKIGEAEYEKKMRKNKNKKKKKDGKNVQWLLGKDSNEWVWVMGEHTSDKKIEDILEKELHEKANQLARQEAEAARIKEEEELKRREKEERILREEQERLAREKAEIERKAREEEERIRTEEAAEKELKERLVREQAETEERKRKAEEDEKRLQEMQAKWQKAAVEEKQRLQHEAKAREKEEERKRMEEQKRRKEIERKRAEQEALMEAAKRKKEQLEREKQEKERQARELQEKAERLRQQMERDRKAHEERKRQSKKVLEHRTEELFVGLKKTDKVKDKMEEKDRENIEGIWKVQLRRSKNADNERSERARRAREEIRQSRLSGNFENLTLDEIYNQALAPEEKPVIRPASGMPRPSQPVNKDDVIDWYRDNQQRKQAGISVDFHGSRPAKWFHGIITRERANEILVDKKPGSFLVRVSSKVWGYVLSYRAQDKVKHFLIDASGETYQFFGADPSQQHSVHNRLGDLITYHKVIPISAHGKEVLRESCGQEGPIPDYLELLPDLGKRQAL